MAAQTYSYKRDGNLWLGTHFKLSEFRCKDGSDTVLVSDELIAVLEKIRTHFKKPFTVLSGYRTGNYNRTIGGAANSQHVKGTAADIEIPQVEPLLVCRFAEGLMPTYGGIGHYAGRFSHIDVRPTRARWQQEKPGMPNEMVSGFWPATLRKGDKGADVRFLQQRLIAIGVALPRLSDDAYFSAEIEVATKAFQKASGLAADGVVGPKTWAALGV